MKMQTVSPKAKTMWLVRNVIWLLVLSVSFAIGLLVVSGSDNFLPIAIILGICWLAIAILLLIWPGLTYRRYTYGYDEKRFILQSGVIFKHQITAPVCQIQDLHFYEGPVMRLFGLGKVMLATGGSNFDLAGLEKQTALALIEDMESKLRARIEVQGHEEI